MAFHRIAKTVELAIVGSQNGEERINVVHYAYPPSHSVTVSELADLCTSFRTSVLPSYEAAAHNSIAWTNLRARDMDTETGPAYDMALIGPFNGTRGNSRLNGSVTHVISKRTGKAGRKYRGRFYTVGPTSVDYTNDLANGAYMTLLGNLGAALLTSLTGVPFTPAVASRLLEASNPWLTATIEGLADNQRRRLQGRGR